MGRGETTTCRAAEGDLDALLDGRLRAERRNAVLRHAEGCAECARSLALARGARQLLLATPRKTPPEGVRAAVCSAVAPDATAVAVLRALPRVTPPPELAACIHRVVAAEAAARQAGVCARFAREVDRLIDGELVEGEALALHRHAAACGACSVLLERARAAASALRSLPRLRPASAALADTCAAVAGERERRTGSTRRAPAWAVAAAAAACLVFFALMYGPSFVAPRPSAPVPASERAAAYIPEAPAGEPGEIAPAEPAVSGPGTGSFTRSVQPARRAATRRASAHEYAPSTAGHETTGTPEPVAPKPDGAPDSFAPGRGHPIVVVASAPPAGPIEPRPEPGGAAGATSVGRADQATLAL